VEVVIVKEIMLASKLASNLKTTVFDAKLMQNKKHFDAMMLGLMQCN
jgi:hypothetical protein